MIFDSITPPSVSRRPALPSIGLLCGFVLAMISSSIWMADAAQNVTLAWGSAPAPGVAGYRLFSGTASGIYTQTIEVGNVTSVSLSNLVEGTTYFFAVTAYNTSAAESAPSNEVSYAVPFSSPSPSPKPHPTVASHAVTGPLRPVVSVSASPAEIAEGDDALLTFSISVITDRPIEISFWFDGTAQRGKDYKLIGGARRVTIPAGQASATVRLHSYLDREKEGKETATINLVHGSGYKVSKHGKAMVTIHNMDPTLVP